MERQERISGTRRLTGNADIPAQRPWRRRRPRLRLGWPHVSIDLRRPRHRLYLLGAISLLALFGLVLTVAGYQAYAYTESAEFCGTACHPMGPQFARYERSPHANVECVDCHIGPGFKSFVQSKIDGAGQVIGVLTNEFDRPIKSPVHNLRPARETCENCHTPTLFKDNIIKTITHYDNDAGNTVVQSTLILKMGGWKDNEGISQGIHWHTTSPVYYIAADEQRQQILWVGVQQPDGSMKEYFARDMLEMSKTSFVDAAKARGDVREMDCIDCHNRTAHEIPPPEKVVDEAIQSGLISTGLPFIRARSVELLSQEYRSAAEANDAINGLVDAYRVAYPAMNDQRREALFGASRQLRRIYEENNFPEMALNWATNPNNQTHTPTLGCFRCHDGKHVLVGSQESGIETISVECNLCHTVPIVGRGDALLVEAPVIVGAAPESHADFDWTITHRDIPKADEKACYQCHGEGFCNNGVCHSLSHPPDMLFSHADAYREQGDQVCYTCHQDILCTRCHPGGIIDNP